MAFATGRSIDAARGPATYLRATRRPLSGARTSSGGGIPETLSHAGALPTRSQRGSALVRAGPLTAGSHEGSASVHPGMGRGHLSPNTPEGPRRRVGGAILWPGPSRWRVLWTARYPHLASQATAAQRMEALRRQELAGEAADDFARHPRPQGKCVGQRRALARRAHLLLIEMP